MNLKVFVEKMGVPDDQAQQVIVSQHASTNVSVDQPTVNLGKCVCVLWKVDIFFLSFWDTLPTFEFCVDSCWGMNRNFATFYVTSIMYVCMKKL